MVTDSTEVSASTTIEAHTFRFVVSSISQFFLPLEAHRKANSMATAQILLQPEHGYILLLAVLTGIVNFWASLKVGSARKKYKINYPQV